MSLVRCEASVALAIKEHKDKNNPVRCSLDCCCARVWAGSVAVAMRNTASVADDAVKGIALYDTVQ